MMVHICNLSTWEVEAEKLGAKNQSQLHREFEAILGYLATLTHPKTNMIQICSGRKFKLLQLICSFKHM